MKYKLYNISYIFDHKYRPGTVTHILRLAEHPLTT